MKDLYGKCMDMCKRPLCEEAKKDVKKYLKKATANNWDKIQGIIINEKGETIWQALIKVDPSFPRVGRKLAYPSCKVLKEWERIPTPFQVLRAIQAANEVTSLVM